MRAPMMNLHLPLLVFLLANAAPSDAGLFARSADSLSRIHHRAAQRSAGLARDLRRAFAGMYGAQELVSTGSQKVYCVNTAGTSLTGSGNSTSGDSGDSSSGTSANGTSSSSATAQTSASRTGTKTSSSSASTPTSSSNVTSPWKLAQNYQGESFFDGWDFWTDADPTHGIVDYVGQDTAQSAGLIDIDSNGHVFMRVDTTPTVSGNRRSVRITTQYSYTGGLVLLDAVHMPTGCGTWPAFWSNGPDWPTFGEIDIVEGVNDYSNNQATIHTAHGCTIPSSSSSVLGITGNVVGGTNCAAAETSNAGCGMTATQSNSYGVGFNNNGGGVYAMQWVDSGISVWFFPRSSIPSDITASTPVPDGWGKPLAHWPSTDCAPATFFKDHVQIFDTTLCGDWAGSVWNDSGAPGQAQSCAARVGVSTCEEFVRNNGASFADAYWEVNYVKIFQ